jgi:hypothetical protein
MASKYTPTDVENLEAQTTAVNIINANNDAISDAFDNTLSLDGTQPNAMLAPLDMNSNRILNLPEAVNPTDPVRLMDLPDLGTGGGGDGDGGIGNGVIGKLYWDLNNLGEPRLRVIPSLSLADPGIGDTTNPGGYKTTNFMFWNRMQGGASKQVGWWNVDVTDLANPATIDAKHSIFGMRMFTYNRVTEGTMADADGGIHHPQEVGPLSLSGVTAAGNLTGKTEGIVCFVSHEDNTADGKLVSGQFGCLPKGADPGRDEVVEDGDGDSATGGPYACYILRLNFSGETRGHSGIALKSGKKLGFNLPMYNGYAISHDSIYAGDRDDSYRLGIDSALPGRSFVHWKHAALNGWGWLGLGTDDPGYHIDIQTEEVGEIIDVTVQNLDDDAVSTATANRTIFRNRFFAINDNGGTREMAQIKLNIVDPTHNLEDTAFNFQTMTNGALTAAFKVGAGAWTGTAGDPGVGALACDNFFVNTVGGINASGKLQGTLPASVKAAVAAAADVTALKAALAPLFA